MPLNNNTLPLAHFSNSLDSSFVLFFGENITKYKL